MSKKSRPTDSGGSWMDTYGDMVTLLLTFFIMLYSMSNLDAQKWSIFVKSIPTTQNQDSENITINSQMSDTPDADSTGQVIGQEKMPQGSEGMIIPMSLLKIMYFSVQTVPYLHGRDRLCSIHLQRL